MLGFIAVICNVLLIAAASGESLPNLKGGAHNSAVECHLHTVEVVGSNPAVPTID